MSAREQTANARRWRRVLAMVIAVVVAPVAAMALMAPTAMADTGGYPWSTMPCARAPYLVSGRCANFDWGPVRNGSEASTFSGYGYGYRNCTDFVAWKLDTTNHFRVARTYGDGASWGRTNAQLTNRTPAVGSVAWFANSNHVAWVEAVQGGNVVLEEYNHNLDGTFDRRTVPISQITGFIHFKDLAAATPTPTPVPGPQPGPVFPVMNTSEQPPDGVWFRDNPNLPGPRLNGLGVYAGDRVALRCYGTGPEMGRYANHVWYQVTNLTRPNAPGRPNTGWLNAHFINDGLNTNQVDAGVPVC